MEKIAHCCCSHCNFLVRQDLDNVLDRIRSGESMESVLKPPQPIESFQLGDDLDSDDGMEADGHHDGAKADNAAAAQHKVEA